MVDLYQSVLSIPHHRARSGSTMWWSSMKEPHGAKWKFSTFSSMWCSHTTLPCGRTRFKALPYSSNSSMWCFHTVIPHHKALAHGRTRLQRILALWCGLDTDLPHGRARLNAFYHGEYLI